MYNADCSRCVCIHIPGVLVVSVTKEREISSRSSGRGYESWRGRCLTWKWYTFCVDRSSHGFRFPLFVCFIRVFGEWITSAHGFCIPSNNEQPIVFHTARDNFPTPREIFPRKYPLPNLSNSIFPTWRINKRHGITDFSRQVYRIRRGESLSIGFSGSALNQRSLGQLPRFLSRDRG